MATLIEKRYALLLSGGINSWNNFPRYLNDLRLMYRTLTQFYGFPQENIWVLYADGAAVDLDGDGQNEIYSPASKAVIEQLFVQFATLLDENSLFCWFVTNHGDRHPDEGARIWLWNEEYVHFVHQRLRLMVTETEVAAWLDHIPCRYQLFVFQQCFSGAFIARLSRQNRIICTACAQDETSYARDALDYDEFLYHFFTALRGSTPDGEFIAHHRTIQSAFQYAATHDIQPEHPQYIDPSGIGQTLTIEGFLSQEMHVSENSLLSTNF